MDKPALDALERQVRPLWLRAQAGDEAAYREALGHFARRLRGYFGRRLPGDAHTVEDLVQETLLAIHLHRGTYDNSGPVTAWLHGIARHKLIDQLRRQGQGHRWLEPIDDLPDDLQPVSDGDATASRDLHVLLNTLPASQRQAILDTKLEGLSVAEAARRQGVSESAVKVHVHRGLKRLAKLIQRMP